MEHKTPNDQDEHILIHIKNKPDSELPQFDNILDVVPYPEPVIEEKTQTTNNNENDDDRKVLTCREFCLACKEICYRDCNLWDPKCREKSREECCNPRNPECRKNWCIGCCQVSIGLGSLITTIWAISDD